jgi:hypothetical protein
LVLTHRVVISYILDDQRCDDPVSQLDTPRYVNDLAPVLPVVPIPHPDNHEEIQV